MTTTWTAVEERIAWTASEDPSYQFVTLRPTTVTLESDRGGGAVDSVNGETGAVVLDAGDVGALDASSGYNTANGWLKLDGDGTVPDNRIPSTIARDSEIVQLGETSSTAYRGDRGKTAYDHSQVVTGNPHGTTAADVGAVAADDPRLTDSRTPTDGSVTAAKFATNVLDTDATLAANSDTRVASQKATKGYVDAVKGGAMGYVNHGSTAGTARPSGYAAITWVGTVEPTHAVNGDLWEDPS